MKKVLLIGCGNTLRADDGVGWHAARRMADFPVPAGVTVLTCHQLTPELAASVHAARRVIFVDASVAEPPGIIRVRPVVPASALPVVLGHFLSPGNLMALAQKALGGCPPAVLVSVGARCFGFGEPLSAEVRRSLPELMDCLCRLISLRTASFGKSCTRDARLVEKSRNVKKQKFG